MVHLLLSYPPPPLPEKLVLGLLVLFSPNCQKAFLTQKVGAFAFEVHQWPGGGRGGGKIKKK